MDFPTIAEWISSHGVHGLMLAIVAQLYLMGIEVKRHSKEMKEQRKALEAHREDENQTRREMIEIGKAVAENSRVVALLLERDRDRSIREVIREEISGVHETVQVDPSLGGVETIANGDSDITPVETIIPPRAHPRAQSPRPSAERRPGEYPVVKKPKG